MKKWLLILTCGLLAAAADVGTPTLHWREAQAQRLVDWLEDARQDGRAPSGYSAIVVCGWGMHWAW